MWKLKVLLPPSLPPSLGRARNAFCMARARQVDGGGGGGGGGGGFGRLPSYSANRLWDQPKDHIRKRVPISVRGSG